MTSLWRLERPTSNRNSNQTQFPTTASSSTVYDKNYVENLRKTYSRQMAEKKDIRNNQKIGSCLQHVYQRLKDHSHPCDLTNFTCLLGNCGRSFDRIQVLAFHISYAHQDLMTLDSQNLTCLICGKRWTTVRRKIMHLSLAHREIGEEHNSQCILQVDPVIAPNAPKALRLEKARRICDSIIREQKKPIFDVPDPFVEDPEEPEDPEDPNFNY